MQLVFLGARLPLTKTYVLRNGVMAGTPYPREANVTSHVEEVASLQEFKTMLEHHAQQGHCLFSGQLQRPLTNESRRGLTRKAPREWIVFDFDKVEGSSVEEVVRVHLPPECQNVSYIAQLSSSMYLPDTKHWSGHVFMLLSKPVDEMVVKQWFEWLNFNTPSLEKSITLSDSLQALRWPLDRTVAYTSRVVFIAPPKCFGFKPEIDAPIKLVRKRKPALDIPSFTPIDTYSIRQKINQLRTAIGEPEIAYETTPFDGHEVLRNAGLCQVHDVRNSGDHYIRFNINGGDSYAYFIDLRNPDIIRNFKGEPFLLTKDAAPELYKALRKAAPIAVAKPPLNEGTEVLAFYATNRDSKLKIGTYDAISRNLTLYNANKDSANAWLFEYGMVAKAPFPHINLVFDPTSAMQFIPGSTELNMFQETPYMARARTDRVSTLADIPPLIDRTLRSLLGDPSDEVYTHFINWLAYIFKERKKTGTAWVFNGRTGTGKGSFVKFILTPLFGSEYVRVMNFGMALKAQFNEFLEQALFVVFEEADINAVENQHDAMSKLNHWITDSPIDINRKGITSYQVDSYSNFIFNTNKNTPVSVPKDDRRLNIAERQETRLVYTPNEYISMQRGEELEAFADVLLQWPVDSYAVTQLVETQARATMHEQTSSINQLVAEAIVDGNLQFFVDNMPSDAEAMAQFHNGFNTLGLYKAQLDRYVASAQAGTYTVLNEEELFVMFRTLIPDSRYFQDSKTWRRRHYKSLGLNVGGQHRLPNNWRKKVTGLKVEWKLPDDIPTPASSPAPDNVTSMRKQR